jgi:hypothetical protein
MLAGRGRIPCDRTLRSGCWELSRRVWYDSLRMKLTSNNSRIKLLGLEDGKLGSQFGSEWEDDRISSSCWKTGVSVRGQECRYLLLGIKGSLKVTFLVSPLRNHHPRSSSKSPQFTILDPPLSPRLNPNSIPNHPSPILYIPRQKWYQ